MRFKAKLFDVQSITQLQNVISAVSKFCKTCCLKLTEDKIYFILNDRLVCGGTTIWCEVGCNLRVFFSSEVIFIYFADLREAFKRFLFLCTFTVCVPLLFTVYSTVILIFSFQQDFDKSNCYCVHFTPVR